MNLILLRYTVDQGLLDRFVQKAVKKTFTGLFIWRNLNCCLATMDEAFKRRQFLNVVFTGQREGRGATVHKRGQTYEHDWLYLQSLTLLNTSKDDI